MRIKNLLSFRKKFRLLLFLQQFKKGHFFEDLKLNPREKYAFIFLAADYGNLGDVAITNAQTRSLKKNLPNFKVVEIPISQSLEGLVFVKKHIKPGDIVTTVGGGNMGDMYDQIEFIRQLVIKLFPKNKIISFPQTFDFSKSPKGQKALRKARKVYNSHKNLTVIAREEISFKLMQAHFQNARVLLVPDIVLSLDETHPLQSRNGVVLCLRNDREKNLSSFEQGFLQEKAKENFNKVTYYDTLIDKNKLSVAEREQELRKIWSVFRGAELVITDRLHGMIFSYITNTPCLVFSNSNHKIMGTYDWIKDCESITLMRSFDGDSVERYLQIKNFPDVKLKSMKNQYTPLIQILEGQND